MTSAADAATAGSLQDPDMFDLPRGEVRRRSLAGVFYVTSSSVLNQAIGFLSSVVLARILTPDDFGTVAVGATAILIGNALADGGLGAGMIRRPEPPTRAELRTLNGIQLVIALSLCVPVMLAGPFMGRAGAVTAIMVASLPITMFATPGRVVLYREMRYDRQLAIDVSSQLGYYLFTVVVVVLGAGVWGLAIGAVVKAIVATVMTAAVSVGFNKPSLRGWRSYGGLLRFGLKFQAGWLTFVAREQCLNIVVGLVAGIASLGIWTFTNRLFQVPSIAFSSLYVVGFPAMSNLLARGEDPGPVIMRTVRRAAIVGAFVFPTFAAASPKLIPAVFGPQWNEAARIMPFICLSTLILGSIAVASSSYLSASGRPGVTASASGALGVVWIAVTAALLPRVGIVAVGVGNLAGALVEATILSWATRRTAGVAPYRPMLRPVMAALVAGSVGWAVCTSGSGGLWLALGAAAVTVTVAAAGLWLVCRDDLVDVAQLGIGILRGLLPGSTHPTTDVADSKA